MISRAAIIREARTWRGTPFAHQAHARGLATDCVGFVGGVGIAVGALAPDIFARHAGYERTPANGALEAICDAHLQRIAPERMQPGDVALLRFSVEPQHLGLLVPYALGGLALMHAYSRAARVIEQRLADVWRARIVRVYAFHGVEP